MAAWIAVTPRLRKGSEVIDRVDSGKFRLLVNRICQSLESGNNDKVFSSEEEEKLSVSLELNRDDLDLLLDTVTSIYSQAAYSIVKPAAMESRMREAFNIQEEKITVLLQAWIVHAKPIVDTLRRKSIFPTRVEEINWKLNVQSSSAAIARAALPTAILQLGLTDASNTKTKPPMTVEMDKASLLDFYNKIEKIQSQLDSLK